MNTDNYSRRRFVRRGLTLAGVAFAWSTFRSNSFAREARDELPVSPDEALAELSAGNKRYVTGKNIHRDFGPERPALAEPGNYELLDLGSESEFCSIFTKLVSAKSSISESDKEIIIFDSTGMALQDVAAAAFLYEKAERDGAGTRLDLAA